VENERGGKYDKKSVPPEDRQQMLFQSTTITGPGSVLPGHVENRAEGV